MNLSKTILIESVVLAMLYMPNAFVGEVSFGSLNQEETSNASYTKKENGNTEFFQNYKLIINEKEYIFPESHKKKLSSIADQYGIIKTVNMYTNIIHSNLQTDTIEDDVVSRDLPLITEYGLQYGIDQALKTYQAVLDAGKETGTLFDDIPYTHWGEITKLAFEHSLEKVIDTYQTIFQIGRNDNDSNLQIPEDSRATLTAQALNIGLDEAVSRYHSEIIN